VKVSKRETDRQRERKREREGERGETERKKDRTTIFLVHIVHKSADVTL
jgi:hypothetical protein